VESIYLKKELAELESHVGSVDVRDICDNNSVRSINRAGVLLERFMEVGNQELYESRKMHVAPEQRKKARTWTLGQASKLIGKSISIIKQDVGDQLPRGANGHYQLTLTQINQLRDHYETRYLRPEGSEPAIMAVVNFKGGVGKTTTTVHLAHKAAIDGLRVLVIDADPQASSTFALGPFIPDLDLDYENVLNGAMLEDESLVLDIIKKTYFPGVDLIPSNLHLQDLDLVLPNNEINNSRSMGAAIHRLTRILDLIKHDYDLILIDCAPNMGSTSLNVLMACNSAIIPLPPSIYDHASFVMLCSSLSQVFSSPDKRINYLKILLTKHTESKTALSKEKTIRNLYGSFVMDSIMPMTVEVESSADAHSSIYDRPASKSRSRYAYNRALQAADAVNNEILDGLKSVWEEQANGY
jgi:chromosome partitioning protein